MKLFKHISFFFLIVTALLTSGHAAYIVLTESLNVPMYLAIFAAIVIDLAAIWLGTHAAELAELGDSVTKVRIATVTVMVTSFALNFMYGYTSGTWVTGLVACIYPFVAAVTYEFWIEHKIRASLRARGRILPESPVYLKSRKYQDKKKVQELHRKAAAMSLEDAELQLVTTYAQRRAHFDTVQLQAPLHVTASLGTPLQEEVTRLQPTVTQLQDRVTEDTKVTSNSYKGTEDSYSVTPEVTSVTEEVTPVTDLGTDVDNIFAGVTDVTDLVTLPDWLSTGMNTPAICIACVSHGVTDLDTVLKYVNIINNDEVSRNTVKTNISRAKAKVANS